MRTLTTTSSSSSAAVQHYVFGYGSLICSSSRAISAPSLAASSSGRPPLPVRIRNVQRSWSKRSQKSSATYLGVHFDSSFNASTNATTSASSCVGVLIPIQDHQDELEALDEREVGYDRHFVPVSWIERVDDLLLSDGNNTEIYDGTFLDDMNNNNNNDEMNKNTVVWAYVPQVPLPATTEFPILQSYIDICLRGCLEIGPAFLKEFVDTTVGWNPQEGESSLLAVNTSKRTTLHLRSSHHHHHHRSDSEMSETSTTSTGSTTSTSSSNESMDEQDDDEDQEQDYYSQPQVPQEAWINDRRDPLYMRADKAFSLQQAAILDKLLFQATKLGGGGALTTKQSTKQRIRRVPRGKKELQELLRRQKQQQQQQQQQ
eukprot:CAMPEP_0178833884 /NCGR_PEP_ID=MMETSP0746-20121128/10789_1 /TAXON_ID=913974 /ORGANISM="Nitzschia punctata, Strain CCMP561" /LENGTH=372 /DNA_ID=CAMNT_0020496337 /DNA_START=99 /DNA_END=1217 /DNA_ORIENTATION=+